MQIEELSPSEFHCIEHDWVSASQAAVEAEAEAHHALVAYRQRACASTTLRMAYALQVRQAASERMRALVKAMWNDAPPRG